MTKTRLEAFSDGVIAIIITIMVLELRPPEHADLAALWELHSKFLAYILGFVFIGIYWSNPITSTSRSRWSDWCPIGASSVSSPPLTTQCVNP